MSIDDRPPPLLPPSPTSKKPPSSKPVAIRTVWAENLESEFYLIRSVIEHYPLISMDTEFPGIVVKFPGEEPYNHRRSPTAHYLNLKANVDLLNLIQIGLAIADENGNLPDLGTDSCYIWEFNFRDFDVSRDAYAPDSVEMLRRQGIDFEKNRRYGVDSVRFAELMMSSGLILNDSVSWITFHSAFDFGYLVKCLTQRPLPDDLPGFLNLVSVFFGSRVYDLKHLTRYTKTLYGGLDRVGESLGVKRVVGKSHQAGSDSLLTLHCYQQMKESVSGVVMLIQSRLLRFLDHLGSVIRYLCSPFCYASHLCTCQFFATADITSIGVYRRDKRGRHLVATATFNSYIISGVAVSHIPQFLLGIRAKAARFSNSGVVLSCTKKTIFGET